jgi:hypothetical protein
MKQHGENGCDKNAELADPGPGGDLANDDEAGHQS